MNSPLYLLITHHNKINRFHRGVNTKNATKQLTTPFENYQKPSKLSTPFQLLKLYHIFPTIRPFKFTRPFTLQTPSNILPTTQYLSHLSSW